MMISIIIVNWNTRDLLLQCIESLYKDNGISKREIIVVDNASSDGSAEAVSASFPSVKLIVNERNLGFAAANNIGANAASGNVLVFLNPDTIVEPGTIDALFEFLDRNPNAGVIGCRIVNSNGHTEQTYWTSFPDLNWLFREATYLNKISNARQRSISFDEPVQVAHLLGACIAIRSELFREVGGFDERYFLYMEETDLCWRVQALGKRNYYHPAVKITHLGQQSSKQAAHWTNVQLQLSTYAFLRRNHSMGPIKRIVALLAMQIGALIRLVLWQIRWIQGRRPRCDSLLMIRGYARLLLAVFSFETIVSRALRENRPIKIESG